MSSLNLEREMINFHFVFLFVCHSKTEHDICLEPCVSTKLNPLKVSLLMI